MPTKLIAGTHNTPAILLIISLSSLELLFSSTDNYACVIPTFSASLTCVTPFETLYVFMLFTPASKNYNTSLQTDANASDLLLDGAAC